MAKDEIDGAGVGPRGRIPVATYRLQLSAACTFRDATALVDYLDALGISDLYLSPIFHARPGSAHGYDILDHGRVNPELGTLDDLRALGLALRQRGMGLLLDVVPNHMCITGNPRWDDILENGPSAAAARWFDIDWRPPKRELRGKVLYPILGASFGCALEGGELQVGCEGGAFFLRYHDHRLPVAPRSLPLILHPTLARLQQRPGAAPDDPDLLELESVLRALRHLPLRTVTNPFRRRERAREALVVRRRLAALARGSAPFRAALQETLAAMNGARGEPRSFDALEELLDEQGYRLSHWRVAAEEINYRRFFDINDLAAIRPEDPEVFAAVHALPLQLLREGVATGLRIDHVDGLYDPRGYLLRLQAGCQAASAARDPPPAYIIVEKILIGDERLPPWPVAGTTGYEFANLMTGVLCEPRGLRALVALYRDLTAGLPGLSPRFPEVLYQCKRLILSSSLASELHVLTARLSRIASRHRLSRDLTFNSLKDALAEVIACLPVYRSYLTRGRDGDGPCEDPAARGAGADAILAALRGARLRNPTHSRTGYDFIGSLLLLAPPVDTTSDGAERDEFLMRFQQLTGPVMAKGLEDTACYRYAPLAALNEVGGSPDGPGVSVAELHRKNQERLARWPGALNATATHDTKRGEDVRARLCVLTEAPAAYEAALRRLRERAAPLRRQVDGGAAPDANDEAFIYQALIGTWPLAPGAARDPAVLGPYAERCAAYLLKAVKEAKRYSSWVEPNEAYEQAVAAFTRGLLLPGDAAAPPGGGDDPLALLQAFIDGISRAGLLTALSQLVIKIGAPGVPDFYQGTELWDLSLVDPDNRRPVDFALRRALLRALPGAETDGGAAVDALRAALHDGRLKLLVTQRGLRCRRARAALFRQGAYLPLPVSGARADHVLAFARHLPRSAALCLAGRFLLDLSAGGADPVGDVFGDTAVALPAPLPEGVYRDALTGQRLRAGPAAGLRIAEAFRHLPQALLVYEEGDEGSEEKRNG